MKLQFVSLPIDSAPWPAMAPILEDTTVSNVVALADAVRDRCVVRTARMTARRKGMR